MSNEVEVMSLDDLERLRGEMANPQLSNTQVQMVEAIQSYEPKVQIEPVYIPPIKGLIIFGFVCFIIMTAYTLYEIRTLFRIGKLAEQWIEKELKKK